VQFITTVPSFILNNCTRLHRAENEALQKRFEFDGEMLHQVMGQEYNNPFYFSKYNILSRTSYSRIGLYLNTELKFSSNSDFFTDFILSNDETLVAGNKQP
jgi:hypothetical protein